MWHIFDNGTVNITLPSIPIPQSAAWIMLTSFPPSPEKCHCNIQLFKGFTLLALQCFRNLIYLSILTVNLWIIITLAIKTCFWWIKITISFLRNGIFCYSYIIPGCWYKKFLFGFVSTTSQQCHLLLKFMTDSSYCKWRLCHQLPIAHVRFPVWCCNSFTIWAFCVGEHRQHTTAGHWQASSTNSCS